MRRRGPIGTFLRVAWYRPMATWATLCGLVAGVYFVAVGGGHATLVRAAAGGVLLVFSGLSIQIRTYYMEANRRVREPDRGALPLYVRRICESYILALLFMTIEIWTHADQTLGWRPLLALAVAWRGLGGLTALIAFERRRVIVVSPFITDMRGAPKDLSEL